MFSAVAVITHGQIRARSEEGCILLTPGQQDPCRQHLAGALQPAKAHHKLSQPCCFPTGGIFLLKGQKNTPLTREGKFNLCFHTQGKPRAVAWLPGAALHPRAAPPWEGGDSLGAVLGTAAHAAAVLPGLWPPREHPMLC